MLTKGRLSLFISGFLNDRHFKVRLGSTFSEDHQQEQGVYQGSILSVTLFALKINTIASPLTPGINCSLYVDDFLICNMVLISKVKNSMCSFLSITETS
jgi:hypothetical protein